jgi:hypothetical protein
MSDEHHGVAREKQVRDIAARLGVADFVYYAPPITKGQGQREAAGDGLLLVGQRGAILQVKSRDPTRGVADSPARATAWIKKHALAAMTQGEGTRRELARRHALGTPVITFPIRAADLPEGTGQRYKCAILQDTTNWPIIVVLDHPQMPEVDLGFVPGVIWFGFSDWWELQRRLRSTSATIEYVHRVLHDGIHVPLWQETARYAALRRADEDFAFGSDTVLPYLADPDDFDELGADIFHDVIDKVWPDDGVVPWQSAEEYRMIVEFLDLVAPEAQSVVGRWILRKRADVEEGQRTSSGLIRLGKQDRLVFACSHIRYWLDGHDWLRQVAMLASLRHTQALESGAPDETKTLAVGVLVEERSDVSYSFVMLNGREAGIPLPADLRKYLEWRYGIHNHSDGGTSELFVSQHELCPCMSEKAFGNCCGKDAKGD